MREDVEFSARRTIVIFLTAFLLLGIGAWQSVLWLQPRLAQRYIDRGVTYVESQNYDSALREFRKAERAHSPEAGEWIQRASNAQTDPQSLSDYWQQWRIDSVTRKLDEVSGPFVSPKAALEKGMQLYATGEPQYAQYAIDEAIRMDEDYPEAWHYRYLVYTKLAEQNAKYREMAEQAREKRDSLTSLYLNP